MMIVRNRMAWLLGLAGLPVLLGAAWSVAAQGRPDPAKSLAAQRAAMAPLAFVDGEWRGTAWTLLPTGEKHVITQTERVGPFLDGAVKVIEGRGYEPDGTVSFNAFAIISYDPAKRAFTMHSHAQGSVGDFVFKPSEHGFVWEIPAGPATIRYTADLKDGKWREIGEHLVPGKEPTQFFESNLERIGDCDWPAAGAVPPK